jgi:nucleoside-diphosphate-sugar epimerase
MIPLRIVVLGLSLSSSWGNGHATTYRALLRAFAARGHEVLFLERDTPWYAAHRDLPDPNFCRLAFYRDLDDLDRFRDAIGAADAVIVGSYVPDGVAVGTRVRSWTGGVCAFYDIDTPVTLAKLASGDHEYLSPEQIRTYDLYLSFTGGPTLGRIEEHYGSPAARQLYCSVDPEAYPALDRAKLWDLSYLGTYSPDRQPILTRLLIEPARRAPNLRFAVAGPQYPRDLDWPANVERIEHVPPAGHPDFYAASRYTLNVTRADMVRAGYSPSVRLFEAASCGTPILSDRWNGLETVLAPGSEILPVDTAADVLAILNGQPESERIDIARAARASVLARHSAVHRAGELETHLREAAARKGTSSGIRDVQDRWPAKSSVNGAAKEKSSMTREKASRVLVAGGAGFIGSHLIDALLAGGARVTCIDNLETGRHANLDHLRKEPRFDFIEADLVDPLPKLPRFDRIFNLACPASPPHYQADPVHTMMTSVIGTHRLLELARDADARLLQASTSEVYGDPDVHPQKECYWGNVNPTGPRACYDEGKRAAETLVFDFERVHGTDVRVARIFNTYGARMRADDGRVVSNVICQALSGTDITIYGDGSQTRSFCYVSDLVEGLMRLMSVEASPGGPVNLGNPSEITVEELVEHVVRLTGTASRLVTRPLPIDDPRRRRPDIARAKALLGWSPKIGLEAGLEAAIAWFSNEITPPAPVRSRRLESDVLAAG